MARSMFITEKVYVIAEKAETLLSITTPLGKIEIIKPSNLLLLEKCEQFLEELAQNA